MQGKVMQEVLPGDVMQDAMASRTPADALRGALLDSRQRWRDLVTMAADFAFETDAAGRIVFLAPEHTLGWEAAALIGRPAATLLAEGMPGFDPFTVQGPTRGRRAWLKRPDGGTACLTFSTMPLAGDAGQRGVGQDVTDQDGEDGDAAAHLRRGHVLDHILGRMRQEVLAPRMMRAALSALAAASGAEGAAVIDLLCEAEQPVVLHQTGPVGGPVDAAALQAALRLLDRCGDEGGRDRMADGRQILACSCHTRFGAQAGLAMWRGADGLVWTAEDSAVLLAVTGIVRVILEHESIQHEMARQARTDPLTGLLNRRAFLEETARRFDRLERDVLPGTLLFADLDGFKRLNDRLGHAVGDEALCAIARTLRQAVRPSDLVARLGGDEFALWLDGAEQFAAAERAEQLRLEAPAVLARFAEPAGLTLSISIGIATRWPGRGEEIDTLMQRADQVMYEVKRDGRGQWRVARDAP